MPKHIIVIMLVIFSSAFTFFIIILAARRKKRSAGSNQSPQRTYHGPTYPGSKRDRRGYGEEVPVHPHHETDHYGNKVQTRRQSPWKFLIVAVAILVAGLVMFFVLALFN